MDDDDNFQPPLPKEPPPPLPPQPYSSPQRHPSTPVSSGGGGSGGGGPGPSSRSITGANLEERAPDWLCPSCCTVNFPFRKECSRCKTPKLDNIVRVTLPDSPLSKPRDDSKSKIPSLMAPDQFHHPQVQAEIDNYGQQGQLQYQQQQPYDPGFAYPQPGTFPNPYGMRPQQPFYGPPNMYNCGNPWSPMAGGSPMMTHQQQVGNVQQQQQAFVGGPSAGPRLFPPPRPPSVNPSQNDASSIAGELPILVDEIDDTEDWRRCKLCAVDFEDEKAFNRHCRGLNHTQRLLERERDAGLIDGDPTPPPEDRIDLDLLRKRANDPNKRDILPSELGNKTFDERWFCDHCNCSCSGKDAFEAHLKGKRHAKTLKNKAVAGMKVEIPLVKPEPSKKPVAPDQAVETGKIAEIQQKIDKCPEPLIGLKYIIEYVSPLSEARYVCNLCEAKCDPRTVISHLIGFKHRLKYLKEIRSDIYAEIQLCADNKDHQTDLLHQRSRELEEEEGRARILQRLEVISNVESTTRAAENFAAVKQRLAQFTAKAGLVTKTSPAAPGSVSSSLITSPLAGGVKRNGPIRPGAIHMNSLFQSDNDNDWTKAGDSSPMNRENSQTPLSKKQKQPVQKRRHTSSSSSASESDMYYDLDRGRPQPLMPELANEPYFDDQQDQRYLEPQQQRYPPGDDQRYPPDHQRYPEPPQQRYPGEFADKQPEETYSPRRTPINESGYPPGPGGPFRDAPRGGSGGHDSYREQFEKPKEPRNYDDIYVKPYEKPVQPAIQNLPSSVAGTGAEFVAPADGQPANILKVLLQTLVAASNKPDSPDGPRLKAALASAILQVRQEKLTATKSAPSFPAPQGQPMTKTLVEPLMIQQHPSSTMTHQPSSLSSLPSLLADMPPVNIPQPLIKPQKLGSSYCR